MKDLLAEMKESKEKRNYDDQKVIQKMNTLYDLHHFWDSQPVPKSTDVLNVGDFDKPIDKEKTVEEIRQEPLDLPAGYRWSAVNIADDEECKGVYDLLTNHYVEDKEAMFRFDYSVKFL